MRLGLFVVGFAILVLASNCQETEDLFEHSFDEPEQEDEEEDLPSVEEDDEDEFDGEITRDDLYALHAHFDGNSDGKVSVDEIVKFHEKSRKVVAEHDVEETFGEILETKGGHLSFDDYLSAALVHLESAEDREHEVQKFAAADLNSDGKVDKSELAHLIDPATHPQVLDIHIKGLMKTHDEDHDGKMSAEEWEHVDDYDESEFKDVDTNKDGFIDSSELEHHEVEGHIHGGMWKLLKSADRNGDKHFSKEELGNMVEELEDHHVEEHFFNWVLHHVHNGREEI